MNCIRINIIFWFFLNSTSIFAFNTKIEMDTIKILLKVKDTSFYQYANISGSIFNFVDLKDSLYLKLSYSVGGYDMGVAGLTPSYKFKSSAPESVYKIITVRGQDVLNWFTEDTTVIRICKCNSLHTEYFSDENPIRMQYQNEKIYFTGKCLSFYMNGNAKEELSYYLGFLTYRESWHENKSWESQVQYIPNSNNISYGHYYRLDGSSRYNDHDTMIRETYPDGNLKIWNRYSPYSKIQIEHKHWSPDKKLIYHWKIVDGKKSFIVVTKDTMLEKSSNFSYKNLQECDSMIRIDSLVQITGFEHPRKIGEHMNYYDKHKRLKARGYFLNNKLMNGKYYIYNCEGVLSRTLIFKNGDYFCDGEVENVEKRKEDRNESNEFIPLDTSELDLGLIDSLIKLNFNSDSLFKIGSKYFYSGAKDYQDANEINPYGKQTDDTMYQSKLSTGKKAMNTAFYYLILAYNKGLQNREILLMLKQSSAINGYENMYKNISKLLN